MPVLTKLMEARAEFHKLQIVKTGFNTFSQYQYFQLSDFLIPAMSIFHDLKLATVTTFTHEMAVMRITDVEDNSSIDITSPMSSANLKAAHEIQNLGAVQTYLRRYLWVAALEIIEHDEFDKQLPARKKGVHKPTDGAVVAADRLQVIQDAAIDVIALHAKQDVVGAFEICQQFTDGDEKTALWAQLPSNVRSAIKKHGQSIKEKV